MKKLTIKDLKKIMLDNFINEYGDLDISGLDFSDFDGDVIINRMKVKKNLFQNCQQVGSDLLQGYQQVGNDLFQNRQEIGGYLIQDYQEIIQNKLKSHKSKVKQQSFNALSIFDFME